MLIPMAGGLRASSWRVRQINHRPINPEHSPALPPLHTPFRRVERIDLLDDQLVEVVQ